MKCIGLGLICLQICVISGQHIQYKHHRNRSSIHELRRFPRSVMGRTTNAVVGQRCVDCQDENSGQCTRKTLFRVKRYTEQLKCLPEATLVKLHTPEPHYSVEPSMARVNRCSRYCRVRFHTCLPVEITFVKVPVILTNHHSRSQKCVHFEVEQHEKCGCDCEIKEEQCSERHVHENCRCKCRNEEEKYECLDGYTTHKKVWDEEKCQCICETELCEEGFEWDANKCRCTLIPPSDIENFLY